MRIVKKIEPGKTQRKPFGILFMIRSDRTVPALMANATHKPNITGIRPIRGVPDSKTKSAELPKIQAMTAVVAMALLAPSQAILPGVILLKNDLILEKRDLKKWSIV